MHNLLNHPKFLVPDIDGYIELRNNIIEVLINNKNFDLSINNNELLKRKKGYFRKLLLTDTKIKQKYDDDREKKEKYIEIKLREDDIIYKLLHDFINNKNRKNAYKLIIKDKRILKIFWADFRGNEKFLFLNEYTKKELDKLVLIGDDEYEKRREGMVGEYIIDFIVNPIKELIVYQLYINL